MKKKQKAVLIFSGGLDSTSLLFDLTKQGLAVECLHFQYGSKHNQREFERARVIAGLAGVKLTVIDMGFIGNLFQSDLLKSGGIIPSGHYGEESMRKTVVPLRNGIMLTIAAGYAASVKADFVSAGVHHGDHTIYPDCRPEFMEAMRETFRTGLWETVTLLVPYVWYDKGDIAIRGYECDAPIFRTYSCYAGGELHCGVCGACNERKEAFKKLYDKYGVQDETEYER